MLDDQSLVDRFYEAALLPELWPETCDRIAASVGAYSTSLITVSGAGALRWVTSDRLQKDMQAYQDSGLARQNVRPARGLQMAPGVFMRDIDLMTPSEMADEPLSRDLLRPLGLAWEMGAVFQEPSGSMLIYSILGRTENGPFGAVALDRLNALKGDLARAALVSARMSFREAKTTTQALSAVGLPSAVIGSARGILSMNAEMESLAPRIRSGAGDRIVLGDADAGKLLSECLQRIERGAGTTVQSMPVAGDEEQPPLVLHLIPIRRNARDIFARGLAILIASPVGETGPPDLRVICGLFDLTRAEARIAQSIAGGASVSETAQALGIRPVTVRSHLRSVFGKTGTRRQAQLVQLLSGLGCPAGHAHREGDVTV